MRILQINATYGLGSTGNIVRDIQSCCEHNGIECYVAYQNSEEKVVPRGYPIGKVISIKLHTVLCRLAGKEAYFSCNDTHRLLHYIEEIQPDVVHLHNLHNHYVNINLLLRYLAEKNIKTVITLHDCWYYTGGCFHYAHSNCQRWQKNCGHCPQRLEGTPAFLYDASASILRDRKKHLTAIQHLTIVGASDWIANEARKSFLKTKKIVTIHNGFDFCVFKPRFSNLKDRLGLKNEKIILGPASKWLSSINRDTLNYFISQLSDNEVLVLFGTNKSPIKLPKNVILYGFTRNKQELAELYSAADAFVNCTREDTLSSINIEAQACGIPIITYDATGVKETVGNNSGFCVSAGDYISLWDKTCEVLKNGKHYYSENCREFVMRNFELQSNYLKYIQLYKSLSNE